MIVKHLFNLYTDKKTKEKKKGEQETLKYNDIYDIQGYVEIFILNE
jgi:hypothetical protein